MTKEIHQTLCGIHDLLKGLSNKLLTEHESTNASISRVPRDGNTPQILARRNPKRAEIWISNEGDRDLFIAPISEGVGEDLFSLRLGPSDTVVINAANYAQMHKREIYGFWDDLVADGASAMITEFSLTN